MSNSDNNKDVYDPKIVEAKWDKFWQENKLYEPDMKSDKPPYVIVLPPPNVTGTLHLGHALTDSVQDCLIRWKRMQGYNALWIPGTDHAGIATQVVVEKRLKKDEGKTRHDIGREAFLKKVWQYKDSRESIINDQQKRLGCSLDWNRYGFTMDETRQNAVTEAFVRMYQNGKIFRSTRIVNWSCALSSAISNIEVDYLDLTGPTELSVPNYDKKVLFGVIHHFSYKIKDNEDEEIVVATTRIETMLGDTGIAVHPKDPRYQKFIGKFAQHPFIPDRIIPIIADGELVDMDFGSGAVKITPAHDPNDAKCGRKHNLETINIMTNDGYINENGSELFQGQHRFECRVKIIEELKSRGLYRGVSPNPMVLGLCSRSKDVIEPILREQWFVDCQDMANRAVKAVENGDLKLHPNSFEKTWFHWLEDPEDWCISRQLWWGHRIPAWWYDIPDNLMNNNNNNNNNVDDKNRSLDTRWIVAHNTEEAQKIAQERFPNIEFGKYKLTQEEDVLDTWFSSGLWPFSLLQWPNETEDLKRFFPGALLETGHDILFFWVARMVMMSLELMNDIPFKDVYLHAMVRDKIGRKMSKSLGNVIDPLWVIDGITLKAMQDSLTKGNLDAKEVKRAQKNQKDEFPKGIQQCGADALRYALLSYTTQARDINLDPNRIIGYRQFCNKLWQAVRYGILYFPDNFQSTKLSEHQSRNFIDKWILSRLSLCITDVNKYLSEYDFANATISIYQFWVKELCSVYLELSKPLLKSNDETKKNECLNTLYICYDYGLRLLHPMMPFVTEELYHRLPGAINKTVISIMIAEYPSDEKYSKLRNENVEEAMELSLELAHTINSLRSTLGIKVSVPVIIETQIPKISKLVEEYSDEIATLTNSTTVDLLPNDTKPPQKSLPAPLGSKGTVYIEVKGIELNLDKQFLKLDKSLEQLEISYDKLKTLMSSDKYDRVPQKQKDKNEKNRIKFETELKTTNESMDQLKKLMDNDEIKRIDILIKKTRLKRVIDKNKKHLKSNNDKLGTLVTKLEADGLPEDDEGKRNKKKKKPLTDKQKDKLKKQISQLREQCKSIEDTINNLEKESASL